MFSRLSSSGALGRGPLEVGTGAVAPCIRASNGTCSADWSQLWLW